MVGRRSVVANRSGAYRSPATPSEDAMDLLALYAQATPTKTALVDDFDGTVRQLNYAELDIEANRLANVLIDRGVAAGIPEGRSTRF